ncbi:MAG TPA: ABC transporter permease [Solirubrobacteraceae bacterium]|nr:ABC transporter permease [Solirubrobacteraceae bacterium]
MSTLGRQATVEPATARPAPTAAGSWRSARLRSLIAWELRKLRAQKRTYLGLGLAILPPAVFVIFWNLHQGPHRAQNVFAREITRTGLAMPVLMLLFESFLLLPIIAALVAGDIFAAEDGNGTLKTILTRSAQRGQIFSAKAITALLYTIAAVYLASAVATAAGVASWGFNSVKTLSGTFVSAPRALLLIVAADACYLIPLLALAAIGLMLSVATRNSAAAVLATVAAPIVLLIVGQIPGLEGTHPYLLTEQFQAWQGLMRTPTDWGPVAHSAWVCALYGLPALAIAYLTFLRRDVAGG